FGRDRGSGVILRITTPAVHHGNGIPSDFTGNHKSRVPWICRSTTLPQAAFASQSWRLDLVFP
ncbi:MAG: hypothetical protein VXX31_07660, partial [Planctomycetota bacterium]|nr:hypothetical protein [Planctomycetota bacterium]